MAQGHDVRIWDVTNPAAPRELPPLTGHRDVVDLMAFAADGRAATISWDHELRLWNLSNPLAPELVAAVPLPLLTERSYHRLQFQARWTPPGALRGDPRADVHRPDRPAAANRADATSTDQPFT